MTKRTLAWVNTQRAKLGGEPLLEMPKGDQGICTLCPLANAFRDVIPEGADMVAVDGSIVAFGRQDDYEGGAEEFFSEPVKVIKCPAYVQKAVARFDCNKYPDLVAA